MKDQLSRDVAALGDDDGIRLILAEVCALTGMGFAAVAYVSDQRWIACQVDDRIDFGLDPGAELEVRKTICDDIRRDGKAVIIDDTDADRDWWSHPVPLLYGFTAMFHCRSRLKMAVFSERCARSIPTPAPTTSKINWVSLRRLRSRWRA